MLNQLEKCNYNPNQDYEIDFSIKRCSSIRKVDFWFLSYSKEYNRSDGIPFDYKPIGI